MNFKNPYFTELEKIQLLQRWIILHSYLYYELDKSVIADKCFDDNCKQLMKMKKEFPKEYKKSRYDYCMKDFDGNTGFDLYNRLTYVDRDKIERDAKVILKLNGEQNNGKEKKKSKMVQ